MALTLTGLALNDRENFSFVVPSSNTSVTARIVTNPDGSNIGPFYQSVQPVSLPALPITPVAGQGVIATTGTAIQLGTNTITQMVIVTAKATNAANLHVGASGVTNTEAGSGTGQILESGKSIIVVVGNTNEIFVNGTIGDIVSFIGS
jgi:hypothetical protein